MGHISDHEEIHALLDVTSPFKLAQDAQGTLAARPAAGRRGRYYLATDQSVLYRDSGTAWVAVHTMLKTMLVDLLQASKNVAGIRVPSCRVGKSVGQSVADSAETAITFDVETGSTLVDNDAMHSISSNTHRITATRTGMYVCGATITGLSNNVGKRFMRIKRNGSTSLAVDVRAGAGGVDLTTISTLARMAVGDYLSVTWEQNSGVTQTISAESNFWATYSSAL